MSAEEPTSKLGQAKDKLLRTGTLFAASMTKAARALEARVKKKPAEKVVPAGAAAEEINEHGDHREPEAGTPDENEYATAVQSWGLDPRSYKGMAAKSLLKATDQATPMMMRKYRKRSGCGLSFLIMVCMATTFTCAFVWVALQIDDCTEENGCKTCSLSIKDASDAYTTCDQMAVSAVIAPQGLENRFDELSS